MTQEEKQLLLQDLSARLPYGVKVFYEYVDDLDKKTYGYSLTLNTWCINELVAGKAVVKPYLRPMSSMTEEERKEYDKTLFYSEAYDEANKINGKITFKTYDYLNSIHIDFRGLIHKGLAIEVTENNNPYKE